MSPKNIVKAVFGLIVVIVLSSVLPFFDNLPWNIPGYKKRAVVKECIRKLTAHPPVAVTEYHELSSHGDAGETEALMRRLKDIYPSPIRMIFREMSWHPATRAWGLVAVCECSPPGALQGKYAPVLKPLIKWLKDKDPIIAGNALSVLQAYVTLPPDYFQAGGKWYQRKFASPAEWHEVYDYWYRREKPLWSQAQASYYCDRYRPPSIMQL